MAHKLCPAIGIDAGSGWTRCVICAVENGHLRFLGAGVAESRGWSKGRVSDQAAISECIRCAAQEAERIAGVTVESAVLGVGGITIQGDNTRGVYEFGHPREIQEGDLGYAVELASRVQLQDGRLLLQVLPQDFTVDGRAGFRNPRGTVCSRLEANVHIVTVSVHDHHAVVSAVQQAHIAVEETVFEPIAAAYACVMEEDRARGVAVADIGAHSTEIVAYDGEALVLAASLPIGGDHFTRDVAQCLPAGYDDARRLKEEYGCAILGLTSDSVLIEIPGHDGRPARETSRRKLNMILQARAEELFYYVRGEIVRAGMEQALLEGVVLTGGGAILNGMCDMAEKELNCATRNGLPVGIANWPEEINDPAWTTAAGLAMWSGRLKCRRQSRRKKGGFWGLLGS